MTTKTEEQDGTIPEGQFHPAAVMAFRWILSLGPERLMEWQETFASTALAGNKTADILGETLRRVMHGEKVSDRYVLGLAWWIRDIEDESIENQRKARRSAKKKKPKV